jgi:hypothetical protein
MYRAIRFSENPLIHPGTDKEIGANINGPSLVRVPEWTPHPMGRYYLYFAHHQGQHIRMAYADDIRGPWRNFKGGVLRLRETACSSHIASPDGISAFERGPDILPYQRHVAVLKRNGVLHIFFSRGEDLPERILVSEMPLTGHWRKWRPSAAFEVLRPEMEYEGGNLPLRRSQFGAVHKKVNELRDPAIYEEDERLFLLYTGAGESNICGAELVCL